MRILALETSAVSGSVAVLEGNQVVAERTLSSQQKTATYLVPAIQDALKEAAWRTKDVQLVAITRGPGSFTGLRVGIATAKTFAYAVGAEVLGVDTLEVLAHQAARLEGVRGKIRTVMDAQRRQLYAAVFHVSSGAPSDSGEEPDDDGFRLATRQSCQIIDREAWVRSLPEDCVITGPVLEKMEAELAGAGFSLRSVSNEFRIPTAGSVGRLAWSRYQAGQRDDLWTLVPDYYRRSAAEEKRSQKSPRSSSGS